MSPGCRIRCILVLHSQFSWPVVQSQSYTVQSPSLLWRLMMMGMKGPLSWLKRQLQPLHSWSNLRETTPNPEVKIMLGWLKVWEPFSPTRSRTPNLLPVTSELDFSSLEHTVSLHHSWMQNKQKVKRPHTSSTSHKKWSQLNHRIN